MLQFLHPCLQSRNIFFQRQRPGTTLTVGVFAVFDAFAPETRRTDGSGSVAFLKRGGSVVEDYRYSEAGTHQLSATEVRVMYEWVRNGGYKPETHRHERQALPRCNGGLGEVGVVAVELWGSTFRFLFVFIVD